MIKLLSIFKKFQQLYVNHIDPDGLQPIHALRTTAGAVLSLIIYHTFQWPQAYWMLFSTLLILQTYNSPTVKEKWQFMLSTGGAITVMTFIASIICQSGSMIVLAVFLMLTTFITVYLRTLSQNIGSAAFYVNLFCLSAGALPVNFSQILERTTSVFLGFFIAVLICLFLWPENLNDTIRKTIAETLSRLTDFNRALMIDRPRNQNTINITKNRLIRRFQQDRETIPKEEIQSLQIMLQIEYLYEIILVLDELKYFIQKQNILKIFHKELAVLSRRLNIILKGFSRNMQGKSPLPPVSKFIHTLESFEKYYHRHLKKFTEEQFLGFTVYIHTIHQLEKRIKTLNILIRQKGFHS